MECACGAQITIEDASELATEAIMARWLDAHKEHKRSDEQWRDYYEHLRTTR